VAGRLKGRTGRSEAKVDREPLDDGLAQLMWDIGKAVEWRI